MNKIFPINSRFNSCISKIKGGNTVLDELDIENIYRSDYEFKKVNSIYCHIPDITPQSFLACFDIDWTLTYSQRHLFPKEKDDIFLLPGRKELLVELIKKGYTIVLFTNQSTKKGWVYL